MATALNVPANERAEILGHWIDGAEVRDGGPLLPITNPATGIVESQVEMAGLETLGIAMQAAERALPAWRATPPIKRARILARFKSLLEANSEEICALVTAEHGKVGADALGELERGIENVEYAIGVPEMLKGEHSRDVGPGIDSWSEFRPVGVVGGITPFNFPVMVPLWMWPMAVACGNTFILKPSEKVPSAAIAVAKLAAEAGLPPGVLNVVNGDRVIVDGMLTDPRLRAVSFVGSTPVAEHVYSLGAANGKRVQALGGAKNHAVVMPDADMDNTVSALLGAAYGSCGERCMAISVAVAVGDETADVMIEKLRRAIAVMKVGPGTDGSNDMGPLISREHREKVRSHVDAGVAEGAKLVVDGRYIEVPGDGYFLGPCLFDRVTPEMSIYSNEIFGPVLCVVRVPTMEEGIDLIDRHEFGNGTCLFTRDGEAARYFSDRVEAGMVGINVPLPVPVAYHSFGGWKRSLFGDLAAYGPDAVRFYTRRKTITQRWPSSSVREQAQFAFPAGA